jgi:hypothetical protein
MDIVSLVFFFCLFLAGVVVLIRYSSLKRKEKSKNRILKDFLQAYIDWLEDGLAPSPVFRKHCGLCYSAAVYGGTDLRDHFRDSFTKEGLDRVYPFNAGPRDFSREVSNDTIHNNVKRRHFAKEKLRSL